MAGIPNPDDPTGEAEMAEHAHCTCVGHSVKVCCWCDAPRDAGIEGFTSRVAGACVPAIEDTLRRIGVYLHDPAGDLPRITSVLADYGVAVVVATLDQLPEGWTKVAELEVPR